MPLEAYTTTPRCNTGFPSPLSPPRMPTSRSSTSTPRPRYQMFISTSDTVISLPPLLASAVNSLFIPPGFLAADKSTYYVHCDSIAPRLEFVISNQTLLINPVDLKRHASQTLCVSSITANSHGHYVLGDLFLRNVLLTLDFRSNTLGLSSRPYYRS